MMTFGNGFGGWYFGFFWQIIWLAVVVAIIYVLVSSLGSNRKKEDESMQILRERLARGEITQEEYFKLKEALSRR